MSGRLASLAEGDLIVTKTVTLDRESLVRYAGASGDFNPIHYRDDVAKSVGLEGVLAHGMLTMGLAIGPLAEWLEGAGSITSYQVRFTKPVYVPSSGSVEVTVQAAVSKRDVPEAGQVTVALSVTLADGVTVLGKAFAVVSPA
jgi:acyl dehydratase